MVVAVGDDELPEEKKGPIDVTLSQVRTEKVNKFRLTVEPLGFLYLTSGIIQVIKIWISLT